MSSNYSITVSNPNAIGNSKDVVYAGYPGGNTLDLTFGNHFGFDLQLGGSSVGKWLVVRISGNILDATGAARLGVGAPWQVSSYEAPTGNLPFFTFNLLPPPGGVAFPDGGSVSIQLLDLEPSAVGVAQVRAQYQFDNETTDNMSVSARLSSLTPPDPGLPPLIGDDRALRPTISVNGGASGNPVMVSASPATAADAVRNSLQVNLLFQSAPSAAAASSSDSGLVAGWDPQHPPAFRVFFPYFDASSSLPAALDLTDSLRPADNGYNEITSAWNIQSTLDPTNPSVTEDGFWQIVLDPISPTPVWLVTPAAANVNLFTAVESSLSEPGPFLDLYFLRIVSALPIDRRNPETILYLQWTHFPGFNDGIAAFPLEKSELTITSFTGQVVRTSRGSSIYLQWETSGDYCQLCGDTGRLNAIALGPDGCTTPVTADKPLRSSYTLMAFGKDGATRVTRSISIQWKWNRSLAPVPSPGANVRASADGKLLMVGGGDDLGVRFFDPETLQPLPQKPFSFPERDASGAVAFAPNSEVAWIVGVLGGGIYGYNPHSEQVTPGSGRTFVPAGAPPYFIGVSPDGSTVAVLVSYNRFLKTGTNRIHVLHSYNLEETSGSPVTLPADHATGKFAMTLGIGPRTGRYYVALAGDRSGQITVLDPVSYQPVFDKPSEVTGAALMSISADETNLFAVSLIAPGVFAFVLSRIDAQTMTVTARRPVGIGFNPIIEFLAGIPLAALAIAPDGGLLFFVGEDLQAFMHRQLVSRLSVFDSQNLQELPWSPIQFEALLPVDLAMAADGSRLFVLAGEKREGEKGTFFLHAVDPEFV